MLDRPSRFSHGSQAPMYNTSFRPLLHCLQAASTKKEDHHRDRVRTPSRSRSHLPGVDLLRKGFPISREDMRCTREAIEQFQGPRVSFRLTPAPAIPRINSELSQNQPTDSGSFQTKRWGRLAELGSLHSLLRFSAPCWIGSLEPTTSDFESGDCRCAPSAGRDGALLSLPRLADRSHPQEVAALGNDHDASIVLDA